MMAEGYFTATTDTIILPNWTSSCRRDYEDFWPQIIKLIFKK